MKKLEYSVNWNDINLPFEEKYFVSLKDKLAAFFNKQKEVWVRDCYACADPEYRINIRVINENPWSNLVCEQHVYKAR